MNNLLELSDLESYDKATQGKAIMVFSTTWCPDWAFYYIDRDRMVDLCIDLDIMGIPSFIAYKDGLEVSRFVNKLRKTQSDIQAFIDAIEE